MPRPRLTVIVVSYNTQSITLECLRSLRANIRPDETRVFVVDNNSPDGSADAIAREFPEFELIALDENIGFGRANNLASERADSEFILLLNPDTVVLDGAIDALLAFADRRPDAGIWGGRTLFPDGSLNILSCQARPTLWGAFCGATGLSSLFRENHLFDPQHYGSWKRDSERDVDIVSGCFLLIRTRLWRDLGGFDPSFFMYGEETDLCMRARALGARPSITPDATIIHHGGASERVRADKAVRLFDARARLIRRHFSTLAVPMALAMLYVWPLTRAIPLTLFGLLGSSRAKSGAASWRSVWSRRSEWLTDRDGTTSSLRTRPSNAPLNRAA